MKRMTKLLVLILSLALVASSLFAAFGVFASGDSTPEGVTTSVNQNFDSLALKDWGPANSTENKSKSGAIAIFPGSKTYYYQRQGRPAIEGEAEGNKYFTFTQGTDEYVHTAAKGPYMSVVHGTDVTNENYTTLTPISENKYFVVDFDIFYPTATPIEGANVMIMLRYLNASGSVASMKSHPSVYFKSSNGVHSTLANNLSSSVYQPFDATEAWRHVTVILEPNVVGDKIQFTNYVAVDGVIKHVESTQNIYGTLTSADFYNGDMTKLFSYEFRINFSNSTSGKSAFDNLTSRSFGQAYDSAELEAMLSGGVGASLLDWDSNLYDPCAMTLVNPVCEINGVQFDTVERALQVAEAGDTVTLIRSAGNVTLTKAGVELDTNGYTVDIVSAASGLTVYQVGNHYKAFDTSTILDKGLLDFTDASVSTMDNATDKNYLIKTGLGYRFQSKGSDSGIAYVEQQTDGNDYFRYAWNTVASGNPYFYGNYNSAASAANSHSNYALYALDLDMFLPSGKVTDGTCIKLCHRKLVTNADGTTSTSYTGMTDMLATMFYDEATGRNYIAYTSSSADKYYLDENTWSHLTLVLTADTVGDTTTLNLHLFVNGEYQFLIHSTTTTEPTATITDIRFTFTDNGNADISGNAQINIDNFYMRAFKKAYDRATLDSVIAKGGNITEWPEHAYYPDTVPYGVTVATNGTKNYDSIQKAVDEAESGDVITLLKSVPTVLKATKDVTVMLGEYTLGGVESTDGYVVSKIDGGYTFVDLNTVSFKYISGGYELFTNDIIAAFSDADNGSTVTLLKDVTIDGRTDGDSNIHDLMSMVAIDAGEAYTFDLGGYTLKLLQNEQNALFQIESGSTLTVKNGTVMAARTNYANATFPIFFLNGNVSLNLNDVIAYGGCVVYNQGTAASVNINGGEYYGINAYQGTQGAGMFATTGELDLTATDAFFFVDSSTAVYSGTSRQRETIGASLVQFNKCTLIADPEDTAKANNLIWYANINFSFEFLDCDIFGGINPTVYSTDTVGKGTAEEPAPLWDAIDAGSILFGEGTRYSNAYAMITGGVITYPDSYSSVTEEHSTTISVNEANDQLYASGFEIITTQITTAYTNIVKIPAVKVFSYLDVNENECITDDIKDAIDNSADGTTITLLMDYDIYSAAHPITNIIGTKTLDLNGFTLTLYQRSQTTFYVEAGTLTVKNGTLRAVRTDDLHTDGNSYQDSTYPVFYAATDNVNLVLEDLVFYGACIFTAPAVGANITVNRGEFYSVQYVQGAWGGIFDIRGQGSLTATDALFFTDSSSWVFTSASRYSKGNPRDNVFTFNGCTLISDPDDSGDLIKYANEYTKVYFIDCDIFGKIYPAVHGSDVTYSNGAYTATKFGAVKAGSISFGAGTRYTTSKSIISAAKPAEGYARVVEGYTLEKTVFDCNDKPFTDGEYIITERAISVRLNAVIASPHNYTVSYYKGGTLTYENDFLKVLAEADTDTVVTLLKDFTLTSDVNGNIAYLNRNLTLDLGGNVFSVYQDSQSAFYITKDFTIRNGELWTVRTDAVFTNGNTYTDKSFPLFYVNAADITINIENVKTYTGALIICRSRNLTVNITGGEHHITHHETDSHQGSFGGFIDVRNDATFNATDTKFFTDRSGSILSSTSTYRPLTNDDTTENTNMSVFTFTNSYLISDPYDNDGNYTLFKHANENTKLVFNNCFIFGSVNPTVFSSDTIIDTDTSWGPIDPNNIVLGEGTRVAKGANGHSFTFLGYSCDGNNLALIDEVHTERISITRCNDKPFTDGYMFEKDGLTLEFAWVVADTVNIAVTFHYPDGSTQILNYPNGHVITEFPSYEIPAPVNNGWVQITYAGGWSLSGYGESIDSLTVTGRIHLYPAATEARAYLSAGLYNLSLYGNVGVNIHLPDAEYMPDGIVLIGVYDLDGNEITRFSSGTEARDITYSSYEAGRTGVIHFDSSVAVRVKYTFHNVEFTQTITVSPLKYLKFVLASKDTNPAAKTLLADMINYADALNKYRLKDDAATLSIFEQTIDNSGTTIYDAAQLYSSSLADESVFDEKGTFDDGRGYIKSITFNVGGADPSYVVSFVDGAKVVDVSFIMKDVWLNNMPGYDKGNVTYKTDFNQSTYNADGVTLSSAHSTGISAYNLPSKVQFILTVLDDNGGRHFVRCEGEYNLGNYYEGITAGDGLSNPDVVRAVSILKALYTYGESSAAYRFGTDNAGEQISNVVKVYYEDFGAKGDGTTDDFGAIKAAHEFANAKKDEGRDVTVYAIKPDGSISEGSTFLIKNDNPEGADFATSAIIRTDVVWDGANIIFDDSGLTDANYATTKDAFTTPIFLVMPDVHSGSGTASHYRDISYTANNGVIRETDTVIEGISGYNLPFEWALLYVLNSKHVHYIRYGANASSTVQKEVIRVNTRTGEIDPATPITHDYLNVSFLRVYDASVDPITIEGGNIVTRYNQINSYDYCRRGIYVTRSNTTVTGITHSFEYSDWNLASLTNGSPMQQIIGTEYTHGVTIDSCHLEGPKIFFDSVSNGKGVTMRGSYSIRADQTSSLTISNITQPNFYTDRIDSSRNESADGMVDHQAVMGTNFCKNMLFENNMMTTFDSHSGLYNVVIRGCEVERINIVGQGTAIIENTTIHTGNTKAAIVLREDYNSNFKGDVYFNNVTLETYDNGYVGLFWVAFYNYNTGLYYSCDEQFTYGGETRTNNYYTQDTDASGDNSHYYSSYLPENVYVNGLKILSGGSVTTDSSHPFGGIYTPGEEDTGVTLALYNGYYYGEDASQNILMIHNWNANISTYGDSFFSWSGLRTVTVKHPICPTQKVYMDATTKGKYSLNDYVYNGTKYNSLEFLDGLEILTLE